MLMSDESGSLHVTLTSRSSTAPAAAATRSGFSANFSFVTSTLQLWNSLPIQLLKLAA